MVPIVPRKLEEGIEGNVCVSGGHELADLGIGRPVESLYDAHINCVPSISGATSAPIDAPGAR